MRKLIGLVALLTIGWCASASADPCATTECRIAAVRTEVERMHATHILNDAQTAAAEQHLKANPKGDAVDKDGTVRWMIQADDCCVIRMVFHPCACDHRQRVVVTIHCPSPKKRPHPQKRHLAVAAPLPPPPQAHCGHSYDMDTRGQSNVSKPSMAELEFYQQKGSMADTNRVLADTECLYAIDLETGERLGLVRYCYGCEVMTHSRQLVWPRDVQEGTAVTLYLMIVRKNGEPGCPSGHCRVFVPAFWPSETSLEWCFMAREIYLYGKMRMFAYFYNITLQENAADVPRGHYHETVTPSNRP